MNRTLITVIGTVAVFALFGLRLVLARNGKLESPRIMPSLELTAEKPDHPLALDEPNTLVTPPYHKPANLPGDWWLRHHAMAQNRGDFNTEECQDCHDVEKYCNRCHGYVGVKSVAPLTKAPEDEASTTSEPQDK